MKVTKIIEFHKIFLSKELFLKFLNNIDDKQKHVNEIIEPCPNLISGALIQINIFIIIMIYK